MIDINDVILISISTDKLGLILNDCKYINNEKLE